MTKKPLDPSAVIDALGGTSKIARLCEVRDPAVSQWRKDGIPKSRLMFLRLAFPKVFKELEAETEGEKRHASRRSGNERRDSKDRRTLVSRRSADKHPK